MFKPYSVYFANVYIANFIDVYLDDIQHEFLLFQLSQNYNLRPYWGTTKYKYIMVRNIYFLYDVDKDNEVVYILGVKFNNKRKTFNFVSTLTQIKTIKKWIADKDFYSI